MGSKSATMPCSSSTTSAALSGLAGLYPSLDGINLCARPFSWASLRIDSGTGICITTFEKRKASKKDMPLDAAGAPSAEVAKYAKLIVSLLVNVQRQGLQRKLADLFWFELRVERKGQTCFVFRRRDYLLTYCKQNKLKT